MEDINLHFTGDFHAIDVGEQPARGADRQPHLLGQRARHRPAPRRPGAACIDMNDRALRQIVNSLGGVANGFPREDGFDIVVASEVMAIFCLADRSRRSEAPARQHHRRLHPRPEAGARQPTSRRPGAMTALLKDALAPNLVQTLENNPAFVHGGPFANIAHGCNSVIATTTALKLADYVVTEAGFGADLGAEKFLDIKCRKAGLKPDCAVLVATIRALKMHGGVAKDELKHGESRRARRRASRTSRGTSPTCRSSACRSSSRSTASRPTPRRRSNWCKKACADARRRGDHGRPLGGRRRRRRRRRPRRRAHGRRASRPRTSSSSIPTRCRCGRRSAPSRSRSTAPATSPPTRGSATSFAELQGGGFGHFPICIAKTQYSFSTDPNLKGAPSDHVVPIREVRLSAGAEFLVVDLRRHHDHARPAEGAGGQQHRGHRRRADQRPVLSNRQRAFRRRGGSQDPPLSICPPARGLNACAGRSIR